MSWLSNFLPDISLPQNVDIDVMNVGDEVYGDLVEGDSVDGNKVDSEYVIRAEGNVIPLEEIERVVQGNVPGESPLQLGASNREIVIDPQNLQREEWDEVVKPGLKEGWNEERSVSTPSAYPILLQAERNVTDEKIQEIKRFFQSKIFTSDYLLLQSSLTLDRAMNAESEEGMTDAELKRRKRELADKYHDAAFSLPSLCTSGYIDEGNLFREVYREMEEDAAYDVDDFDVAFRKLIRNKPFVAYAHNRQSEEELTDIVRGKIDRHGQYDVPLPYIDVRGIGRQNHQKIREVMATIDDEYEDLEYDEHVGDDELIARIDASTI